MIVKIVALVALLAYIDYPNFKPMHPQDKVERFESRATIREIRKKAYEHESAVQQMVVDYRKRKAER